MSLGYNSNMRKIAIAVSFSALALRTIGYFLAYSLVELGQSYMTGVSRGMYFSGFFSALAAVLIFPLVLPTPKGYVIAMSRRLRCVLGTILCAPGLVILCINFDTYMGNLGLRNIATFCLGTQTALTYGFFFLGTGSLDESVRGRGLRGMLFALIAVLGPVVQLLASYFFPEAGGGVLILRNFYGIIQVLAVLVFLCTVALFLIVLYKPEAAAVKPRDKAPAEQSRGRPILRLVIAVIIFYQLNGFLNTRLLPFAELGGNYLFLTVLFAVALPLTGYWFGTDLQFLQKKIYPVASAFFILAPALFLLSGSTPVYWIVYTLIGLSYFTVFNTVPFIALEFSYNTYWFYFLTAVAYIWRLPSFFSSWMINSITLSPGTATFTATIFALAFYFLIRGISLPEYTAASAPEKTADTQAAIVDPREQEDSGNVITDADIKSKLSRREQQVAYLLIQNYTNKEIAEQFYISEGTVENHNHSIYRKLNVTDRTDLGNRYRSET